MPDALSFEQFVFHLAGPGPIPIAAREPAFWSDRDRRELAGGQLLSVFSYEETWDYEERHPDGDELVAVLTGDVDLLLDAGAGTETVRVRGGQVCIIPAWVWHRVAVHEPSTMLFVTPVPARTEHRTVVSADRRVEAAPRSLPSSRTPR